MRTLAPTARSIARQRHWRTLGLAVLLFSAGCASVGTDGGVRSSGAAGGVMWEVSDIGRVLSADNQRIRWSYVITLRNTSDRTIQIERVERAITWIAGSSSGGTPTSVPFRRTLGARSDLRIPAIDNWGWPAESSVTFGGAARLPTATAFYRYSGTDDQGKAVDIQVLVHLDPSAGVLAKPLTRPENLPAPTTLRSASDLARLVGLWRGSYRLDKSILDVPIEVTILADGTLQIAENEPVTTRFRRTVQVKDGELDYSGGRDRGTLTLHEMAGRRMLVGRVSQTDGTPYAVYLEAQAPANAAPGPLTTSPPTVPSPVGATPGMTRQEQEEARAAIARAKEEAYRRLNEANAQSQPAAAPAATASPAVSVPVITTPGPLPTPAVPIPSADEILTNESIVSMVKAGLDEAVILAKITATPARFDTRTEALIELRRAGVPDRVLAAMVAKR